MRETERAGVHGRKWPFSFSLASLLAPPGGGRGRVVRPAARSPACAHVRPHTPTHTSHPACVCVSRATTPQWPAPFRRPAEGPAPAPPPPAPPARRPRACPHGTSTSCWWTMSAWPAWWWAACCANWSTEVRGACGVWKSASEREREGGRGPRAWPASLVARRGAVRRGRGLPGRPDAHAAPALAWAGPQVHSRTGTRITGGVWAVRRRGFARRSLVRGSRPFLARPRRPSHPLSPFPSAPSSHGSRVRPPGHRQATGLARGHVQSGPDGE